MPKKNHKEMETFDIKEKVIFSAGVHNGDLYTEDDLKAMEDAFYECKGKLRPPLKLGHSEDQSIWERDGLPAIGWIDNVKAVGKDLIADFVKVPKVIYELIQAGAYRTVSAEIYWNAIVDGKKYPYALKALALLGADIPAVKTVSDILALYKEDVVCYKELEECEVKKYEGPKADEEKKTMPEEKTEVANNEPTPTPAPEQKAEVKTPDINEVITKLEGIVASLTEKKTANEKRIAELTEKLATAEKNYTEAREVIAKAEEAKKFADLENKVDSLIGEKKLMPAQKPAVMRLLSEIPLNKSYRDGELENTIESLLFGIFKQNSAAALNTEEKSAAGERIAADDEVAQINKISKDKGLSYKEAYKVWKQNRK